MTVDNNEIETQVAYTLLVSESVGRALFEVANSDGIITLKGRIETEQHKTAAEALVRDQEGVEQVINNLEVTGS